MEVAKIFVKGVVAIGIATALFMNGRNTAGVLKAGFGGASHLLGTAETGRA
jgi:hypothetical protein